MQILGLRRVFRGLVGLEMEVAAGDEIAKEGGNDLIPYDEKDLEDNRQGSSWKMILWETPKRTGNREV